jgi:integrase
VIGLLLGCRLRRSEAANLRIGQLQLRESHWVIVDMVGKGGRLRTVSSQSNLKEGVHTIQVRKPSKVCLAVVRRK